MTTKVNSPKTSSGNPISHLFKDLWLEIHHEIEHTNPLQKSYFVSDTFLKLFRYFVFIVNTITFVWTMNLPPMPGMGAPEGGINPGRYILLAYLTIWAFMICWAYSLLVIVWADAPAKSMKWKIIYILGELGFAAEMMICPFFFLVLFPIMLKVMDMSTSFILYNILIHLIVPILMWLEIIFSNIAFPNTHKVFLYILTVSYLVNNFVWTMYLKRPIYPPIDWVNISSYILCGFAILMTLGGFALGGRIHRWKLNKFVQAVKQEIKKH